MEPQQAFTKIVTHLRAQNRQSKDDLYRLCLYKAPNSDSCAVGCMIPDDQYSPNMEGKSLRVLMETFPDLFNEWPENTINLMSSMQTVHDVCEPDDWEERFGVVATAHKLVVPEKEA